MVSEKYCYRVVVCNRTNDHVFTPFTINQPVALKYNSRCWEKDRWRLIFNTLDIVDSNHFAHANYIQRVL